MISTRSNCEYNIFGTMDSSSQLPLLPSERKEKAERYGSSSETPVSPSPTRVSTLSIAVSEEDPALSQSDDNSPARLNDNLESPIAQRQREEEEERYRADRNELVTQHFSQLRPLPASTSSKQLLRFMLSTTSYVDLLASKVDARLTEISNKIGNIETKVNLLGNRLLKEETSSGVNVKDANAGNTTEKKR